LSPAKPFLRNVKQAIRTREEQVIHPVRLAIATALFLVAGLGFAPAQSSSTSGGPVDPGLIEDLVAANRILAEEGVLDAYGHVSIRHPSGS
jgi:HCOMODA/2-hydroxy-3-carboxy-muconic semialdehyde decarboxylase